MQTVDEIIKDIIRREGGYSNNPKDKGGATNYGISLRYARNIGLDNNKDGLIDEKDILLVNPVQAAILFKQDFYYKFHFDTLPSPFKAVMFDMAVMSGGAPVTILLQETLNDLKCNPRIKEDGYIGPRTRAALAYCIKTYGVASVMNALTVRRIKFYKRIVERDPSQEIFLKGWINRAQEFLIPSL